MIDHVATGSPAAQAGIKDGDRMSARRKRNPPGRTSARKKSPAYQPSTSLSSGMQRARLHRDATLSERLGVGYAAGMSAASSSSVSSSPATRRKRPVSEKAT